jgi:hypothetical protein
MMKKNIFRIILIIAAISIGITGCQKEDENGPAGSDRDKFLGTWKVSAKDQLSSYNYQMSIRTGSSSLDQVLIDNFDANSGTTTTASISGNNISIPQQIISGDTIVGSGTYNNGSITLHYTVRDGQENLSVTATATR